jgi:anti-sigma-K factor RskA
MTEEEFFALAGEYALGLLDGEELAQADAMRREDARFAAAIRAWESRLLPLLDEVRPSAPPARVWARIRAATAPARSGEARRWAWPAGLLAAGLAVVFAVVLLRPPAHELARLASRDGGVFLVAEAGARLEVSPQNISLPAGKTGELWLVVGNAAPRALGLIDAGHGLKIALPAARNFVLAVSVEPPGGSPTGRATGPVIAEGAVTTL